MLKNYELLNNGVIKQIKKIFEVNYNIEYIENSYNQYGELGMRMGHLRLGYLIGCIGFIPNSILDIGYGNGDFLRVCTNLIDDCYGNDISGYKVPENVTFISDPYENKYDVVSLFDVIEHFDNIYDLKNLKTDYLYVSTPNCHYESDEWFEKWKHRRPDEHLWHFNRESLINFMLEIGYQCLTTSNIEDTIRKSNDNFGNILTGIFKKI
jgi:hypothetical protein